MADARDTWNEVAGAAGCPKALALTETRKPKLRGRLAELKWDLAAWRELCVKVAASEFCRGINDRGWVATFDWMLERDTATKIAEGKYDDRPKVRLVHSAPAKKRYGPVNKF